MTNIIRLNEAINDYVSRPVITQLGEPLIALNASTHITELGGKSSLLPSDILLDGSYGQILPNPFIIKIGAGNATVKSDSNGSYVSFNNCGFRANESATVFNYDKSKSVLLVSKFRVATLAAVTTEKPISRIFSFNTYGPLLGLSVSLVDTKKYLTVNVGVTEIPIEELTAGKIYTIAVLRTPTQCKVFIGPKTIVSAGSVGGLDPNLASEDIKAMGLNVRSIVTDDTTPLSNTDIFSYEFYGNGAWSDAQIQNYLSTL